MHGLILDDLVVTGKTPRETVEGISERKTSEACVVNSLDHFCFLPFFLRGRFGAGLCCARPPHLSRPWCEWLHIGQDFAIVVPAEMLSILGRSAASVSGSARPASGVRGAGG